MANSHAITTERLVHVLQGIALKQMTGRLNVEHTSEQGLEKGEIFFVHGNTVFAHTAHESGETALFNMMRWQEISVTFFIGEQSPASTGNRRQHSYSYSSRTIQSPHSPYNRPNRPMLPIELEETRQTPSIGMPAIPKSMRNVPVNIPTIAPQEQATKLNRSAYSHVPQTSERGQQPGTNAIFRALPVTTMPQVISQMDRKDRVVFLLLDGKRTLSAIKHLVNRSEYEVANTLMRLHRQGHIEYIQG